MDKLMPSFEIPKSVIDNPIIKALKLTGEAENLVEKTKNHLIFIKGQIDFISIYKNKKIQEQIIEDYMKRAQNFLDNLVSKKNEICDFLEINIKEIPDNILKDIKNSLELIELFIKLIEEILILYKEEGFKGEEISILLNSSSILIQAE